MYYNDNTILFLDGKYIKAKDAKTDLFGQTLHYGYGVFEGIRAYETVNGIKTPTLWCPPTAKPRSPAALRGSAGFLAHKFNSTKRESLDFQFECGYRNLHADCSFHSRHCVD